MAITPAPGYQIDPSNPNGVIPIGQAPAAQAPVTPAPTIQTPAAPGISTPAAFKDMTPPAPPPVQVNVNNGQQPQAKPQANTPAPGAGPLAMPGNGSVVDLLNAAGTDSSFANRSTLAQQYGIQGYTGTAAQNQELAKKYLDAFNANKNTKVPDTPAQAQSALDTFFEENTPAEKNPQAAFFDAYAEMNPVVKTLYDTINKELSSVGRQISFTEQYQKLVTEQGIPGLQTDLLNIERIMDGTEDDIREEITKVGGFATESQVQALKGARNKTLLKQANFLQGQLQMRNDYVKQIMELTQADREQVERDVDRKLGLTTKLFELTEKMQDGAKENYQSIVDKVGYQGLANAFKDDPYGKKLAEQTLGLPLGSLSNPKFLAEAAPEPKPFQFVSGTDNQASGVFDPNTGKFTPRSGGGTSGGVGTGGTGGTGTPGVATGSVARDADSIMAGNLNLQDVSTKDNYRSVVAAEVNRRAQEALVKGDIYGVMKASAAYDKEPSDTFVTSMEKLGTVLGQIGVLQENISMGKYTDEEGKTHSFSTGPIEGAFRSANPWDTKAQTIKAQLNAIIPNLARGIYGEVGVLTDNDIANYAKTLPNLKSTADIRNAVLYITVDMIRKNAEIKIKNQASAQRDMSGYADYYKSIIGEANSILGKLPGSAKPGAQGTPKGSLSSKDFVSQAVQSSGKNYDSIIKGAPKGQIAVVDNDSGQIGYIPVEEFNSSAYTRM